MNVIVVIPARYDSSRFPGKPLAKQTGKYLVEHVHEQVRKAKRVDDVLIATDDERIKVACREFGAKVVMTRRECPSGTDRMAEAVAGMDVDIVVNVQGDEPEINPEHIDEVVNILREDEQADIATLATVMGLQDNIHDSNVVKVVISREGHALYFSRLPIPYQRDPGSGEAPVYRRHVGLYAYWQEKLVEFTEYGPTMLEKTEKLEQLRALEHGMVIAVREVTHPAAGIDTPEQYAEFVSRYKRR